MKKCTKCKVEKENESFFSHPKTRDKLQSNCKKCQYNYLKTSERYKEYQKKYHQTKKWKEYKEKYRKSDRHKELIKLRKNTDPQYKLSELLRSRLRNALLGNFKAGSAVRDLGCSIDELKAYLEKKFQEGMTWENHGEWHIDHKIPLDSFDLTDRQQLLQAVNYTNLQPLWAHDNLVKWNRTTT